jgi:hypothetical protein
MGLNDLACLKMMSLLKRNFPDNIFAALSNESFNADANIGHRFAILMANVSALRAPRSGAG